MSSAAEMRQKMMAQMARINMARNHIDTSLDSIHAKASEWEKTLNARHNAAHNVMQSSPERNVALKMMNDHALTHRAQCQQVQAAIQAHRERHKGS